MRQVRRPDGEQHRVRRVQGQRRGRERDPRVAVGGEVLRAEEVEGRRGFPVGACGGSKGGERVVV